MHEIEPYYNWRNKYIASEDPLSPFFGRKYDEFYFTQKIYNYYIHPQWDSFGSATLYMKILYADYELGFAVFEMIGEWNDCLHNDIMFLKRDVVDEMLPEGINKFIVICENVLNFHASDDCYYEEWYEDVKDKAGWICFLDLLPHVEEEMKETRLDQFVHLGPQYNHLNWRTFSPNNLLKKVEQMLAMHRRLA
ncbi:MAG TPA: hypothetical protein ENJ20_02190 [Bacteroidetes bacterium]|nr:hypothetical protein [Bacteroidota bacterium]